MSDWRDRLTSRKFLLTVAGVLYVIVQTGAGALSPTEGVDAIKVIIAAYIASEGIADAAARHKPDIPTPPAPAPPQ